MVRLCVVAPTVNVHLNRPDEPEESEQCKAPVPRKRIKHIIGNEVLPRFTKIFFQKEENKAPDGAANLDSWLEHMLSEMQTSIESHLQDVFQEDD